MEYTLQEVKDAYNKLRTYVFYDNTNILLRKQIVEFETNITKNINSLFSPIQNPYKKYIDIFNLGSDISVDEKLDQLTNAINSYHKSEDAILFIDTFLKKVNVNFYPKKIKSGSRLPSEIISNERVFENYSVDKVIAFIDAPIELHILSVLWITEEGVKIDADLFDNCKGNRLLLNQEKNKIVQGSGLFKPYYKQYQKWRDESINVATNLLNDQKSVLFVNLDIKDYFHSVRLKSKELFDESISKRKSLQPYYSVRKILLELHENYTLLVSDKYQIPNNFYNELKKDKNNNLEEFILPIGLLSSYVLGNKYLKSFDEIVSSNIRPAYYGRYVDDIIMVFPIENEQFNDISINDLLSPALKKNMNGSFDFENPKYKSLTLQKDKTLFYFFKYNESTLVIDKLKKELDERTSEFRDIPSFDSDNNDIDKNAYHLLYDDSEGKIKTLKDYKENRFGLTIYLTNKIFSSLRQENKLSDKETTTILSLFRGVNCIEYYQLWEKIFTLFLVNEKARAYIEFYFHCIEQINKIGDGNNQENVINTSVEYDSIKTTLIEYLDCVHELCFALNPGFINKSHSIYRNFEMKKNTISPLMSYYFDNEITDSSSFWITRFRKANFVRHQYIIHPLLNYTKGSKNTSVNFTSLSIDYSKYKLDDDLLENSPRPIKFWECCTAYSYNEISNTNNDINNMCILSNEEYEDPFDDNNEEEKQLSKIYLHNVFEIFKKANTNHIPYYILSDNNYKLNFVQSKSIYINDDICANELNINTNNNISKPRIAFANTEVCEENIIAGLRGKPILSSDRYNKLALILNKVREENADILLFPEFFIPINFLSSLSIFSVKNQTLIITGLEHINYNKYAFNYIVTIIPIENEGIRDSIVLFRLKNHYAPSEELLINGNHLVIPKPIPYRYDLVIWKNIYFSTYYCFELANIAHRCIFKSKIDLLIAVEWNKDTPYFSNIVEASTRDLHVYVAQVNTSQYGDSRLTQPTEQVRKDILKLKGGINDTILVAEIDIPKLREFQRKTFMITKDTKEFKPLPPDYNIDNVLKRIENKSII